jgi:hypothetical protein
LALGWTSFKTLFFLDGPALDEEAVTLDGAGAPQDRACTILDESIQTVLIFAFLQLFFRTSAFHLSLAA